MIRCANLRQQASADLSKTDVNAFFFFMNLKEVFGRLRLGSVDIWNMEETGIKRCKYMSELLRAVVANT
jgi:hypothetical protein